MPKVVCRNFIHTFVLLPSILLSCQRNPQPNSQPKSTQNESVEPSPVVLHQFVWPEVTPAAKEIARLAFIKNSIEAVYARKLKNDQEINYWLPIFEQYGGVFMFESMLNTPEYKSLELKRPIGFYGIRFYAKTVVSFDSALTDTSAAVSERVSEETRLGVDKSEFVLKRLLQEKILKVALAHRANKKALVLWASQLVEPWEDLEPYPSSVPKNSLKDNEFYISWFSVRGEDKIVSDVLLRMHLSMDIDISVNKDTH